MLKRILITNISKRFNNSYSKTTFLKNYKDIEHQLFREQNKHLDHISDSLKVIGWVLITTQITCGTLIILK
jgi:hypothetical protein